MDLTHTTTVEQKGVESALWASLAFGEFCYSIVTCQWGIGQDN